MDRRPEDILAIYTSWWRRALKEFLNGFESRIEEWMMLEARHFRDPHDPCRSEVARLVARLIIPSDKILHDCDIHIFDMERVIQNEAER